MKNKELKGLKLRTVFNGFWIWVLSLDDPGYYITGKYLFFSEDQDRLIEIAKNEISNHGFHKTKVNSRLLGKSTEYVLCLYYKDDSRKYELAERQKIEYADVTYRYWKSDEATLRGEYSNEFLNKLSKEQRERFISQKKIIEFKDKKGRLILRQKHSRNGTKNN